MTAPFSPHMTAIHWTMVLGILAVVLALPFSGRKDWIGWLALLVLASFAVFMPGMLIVGLCSRGLEWWHGQDD